MRDDGVDIWGDGSTYKGNDIERFYRYGLLVNPKLRIYKPWLDPTFVDELGGRAEMSEWLRARDLPYRDSTEKAYSTDANIWGATHEAKQLEELRRVDGHRRADHGRARTGTTPSRSTPRRSCSSASKRAGRSRSTASAFADQVALVHEANAIGGRHGLGMSDQIENRIIEAKSRGIYEAPGMALLHIAYERLVTAIHNEGTHRELPHDGPPPRPAAVRGPLVRPAGLMLREPLQRWVGSAVTGEVTCACAAARTTRVLDTTGPHLTYQPERLSMERTEDAAFGPLDRIGQLTMRNLDIDDTRAKLELFARSGLIGASTGSLLGRLEAGGAEPIADIGAPADAGRRPRRAGRHRRGHGLARLGRRVARRAGSVVAQEARDVEHVARDLERAGRAARSRRCRATARTARSTASPARGARGRFSKPVAITVTRMWSPSCSSTTAPKMMLAFWSAALATISAASLTSNRPRSPPPVMLSRMPVAPSTLDSSSGWRWRRGRPRRRGSRPRPCRCPSAPCRTRA